MFLNISYFLFVSVFLFFSGLLGIVFNKQSVLLILLCIELILLSINLNLIVFSVYLDDILGQIFALYVLTVAASESAVGLGLLIAYYRVHYTLDNGDINLLQGLIFF